MRPVANRSACAARTQVFAASDGLGVRGGRSEAACTAFQGPTVAQASAFRRSVAARAPAGPLTGAGAAPATPGVREAPPTAATVQAKAAAAFRGVGAPAAADRTRTAAAPAPRRLGVARRPRVRNSYCRRLSSGFGSSGRYASLYSLPVRSSNSYYIGWTRSLSGSSRFYSFSGSGIPSRRSPRCRP